MSWLDLHMHTFISNDGEFMPDELMELCGRAGLKTVAIADHNSTRAYKLAAQKAEHLGIELIPAVELDCTFQGTDLHVLGYGIDTEYEKYRAIEKELLAKEQEASTKRVELVEAAGVKINHEVALSLAHDGVLTGEVIAETALMDSCNHELLKEYLPGGTRSDNPFVNFYWDWCSQGKIAYVPIEFISLESAVAVILESGGIPVLAHPGNNVKEDEKLLEGICSKGVCGMEVFSSYHSKEQTGFYLKWAQERNLLITAGSDFHGKTKPSISLGKMDTYGMEEQIYRELKRKMGGD